MNNVQVIENDDPRTVGDMLDRLPAPHATATVPQWAPPPQPQGSAALMLMIERAATSADFDVAKLEKLLEVRDRWEAGEARKAYLSAIAAFKSDAPKIIKNKHVSFDSRGAGGKTEYDHATLDQVCDAVGTALSSHGVSHDWKIDQGEGGLISVTCVLTHVLGHSERVTLKAGADQSGGKNNIQAVASTVTYLERYTLLAATGLAAKESDDDGRGSEAEFITVAQKETLIDLQKEVGAETKGFLKYLAVPTLDDLPASRYADAVAALEKKRGAKK